jgi:hypothetical protein
MSSSLLGQGHPPVGRHGERETTPPASMSCAQGARRRLESSPIVIAEKQQSMVGRICVRYRRAKQLPDARRAACCRCRGSTAREAAVAGSRRDGSAAKPVPLLRHASPGRTASSPTALPCRADEGSPQSCWQSSFRALLYRRPTENLPASNAQFRVVTGRVAQTHLCSHECPNEVCAA